MLDSEPILRRGRLTPVIYNQWSSLGEKWETGNKFPESEIVFCTCDHIDSLFRTFGNELDGKTVISAESDFHPCYQLEYPPAEDFRKFLPMMSLEDAGYSPLYMPPRINVGRSLITDKYSIRMYSFTNATFNKIPNIKWFCVGAQINGCKNIPFGTDQESFDIIQKYKDLPKKERIFYCCSFTTNERATMFNKLKGVDGVYCNQNLDKEQYYYEMCSSKFHLVMAGNSPDTYRHLDCLYAGVIPVTVDNVKHPYKSLLGRLGNNLQIAYNPVDSFELADFDFWRKEIEATNITS
jgi:hypothetical protein